MTASFGQVGAGAHPWIYGYTERVAKVLLSINEELLRLVDDAADKLGMSRSAYLSRLAARELEASRAPGTTARARSAIARLDRLFSEAPRGMDAVDAIRAEREARLNRLSE